MCAADGGKERAVKLLLENGADSAIENYDGDTALCIAKRNKARSDDWYENIVASTVEPDVN